MKFIFAIKTLDNARGGAERVLADVTAGLAARGHNISILTFDARENGQPFYPLGSSINQIRLGIGAAGEKATLRETISRMWAIRKTVKLEKPDIIVAFMHSMFVPMSFAVIGLGIPVIASEHIVPDHYKTRRFEFFLLLISSFFIKKITVLSPSIARTYPAFLQSKMVIMPNPVMKANVTADTVGKGKFPKTILNVGRLDPQKDQETLIRAYGLISKAYPDWRVLIVGEGNLKNRLLSLIRELKLQDHVFIAEPTREISAVYGAAQIFALPSLYESFGLATAEAMAHGLPPVGFADCPGTSELIQDGKTGILVKGKDRVSAYAEGMRKLLDSPDLRLRMGNNAKNHVAQFSKEMVINKWEECLNHVKA